MEQTEGLHYHGLLHSFIVDKPKLAVEILAVFQAYRQNEAFPELVDALESDLAGKLRLIIDYLNQIDDPALLDEEIQKICSTVEAIEVEVAHAKSKAAKKPAKKQAAKKPAKKQAAKKPAKKQAVKKPAKKQAVKKPAKKQAAKKPAKKLAKKVAKKAAKKKAKITVTKKAAKSRRS